MNWNIDPFTVLDTETTGFRKEDRVIELAFLRFEKGVVIDKLVRKVDPGMPIPEEASRIHGIRDEHVRNCPRMEDILGEVIVWLEDSSPLVAHNLPFDMRLLSYSAPYECWNLSRAALCTLDHAKNQHPELRNRRKGHKLVDCAEYFNIPFDATQAHGAEYDAQITGALAPLLFGSASPKMLGNYIDMR